MITLTIESAHGNYKANSYKVKASGTVHDLKLAIWPRMDESRKEWEEEDQDMLAPFVNRFHREKYDLIFQGEILNEENTLDKYNIKSGGTITHMDRDPQLKN